VIAVTHTQGEVSEVLRRQGAGMEISLKCLTRPIVECLCILTAITIASDRTTGA